MSDKDRDEEREKEEQTKSGISISIGGGVGGDVTVAEGDVVSGDKISVGDITGSQSIAVGRGAQASVTEGADAEALARVFAEILAGLEALEGKNPQDIADAREAVEEIKVEAGKGEAADEGFVARRLRNIARMGPDILDVVTASIVNPAAGVALAVRKVAQKARQEAGLEPVD